jgi:hypothetical protein
VALFLFCILNCRYFAFSPPLNRGVSRTKLKPTADEMGLNSELKIIVEVKLKGKEWGNDLEDRDMYSLGVVVGNGEINTEHSNWFC